MEGVGRGIEPRYAGRAPPSFCVHRFVKCLKIDTLMKKASISKGFDEGRLCFGQSCRLNVID